MLREVTQSLLMHYCLMSELYDKQKQSTSSIRKLLQERIEKANVRRNLTAEECKRLNKLEAIANKLKSGENVDLSPKN